MALISVSSSPQPYTANTGLVHHTVCLFTSQLSLVLILPTRRDG